MTYDEKKSLYESIMKQVARIVRKHLDESSSETISALEDEIVDIGKTSGNKYVDLEHLDLQITFNYEEPDEAGRIVDDYPMTVTVKSASINDWGVTFDCVSYDDMGYEDTEHEISVDEILNDEEAYEALRAVRENM